MMFMFSLTAQEDCDCPDIDWGTEGICVLNETDTLGFALWAPDECYAACWYGEDYTIVDCENDWEWEDEDECDCPEEDWFSDGICLEVNEYGSDWTEWAPSECYAACWFEEYTVIDCNDIDWGQDDWEWEVDCDCPEDDWDIEGICVEISLSDLDSLDFDFGFDSLVVSWVPSECYAACFFGEYVVVECDDYWDWEDECDCPEEDWDGDGICIEVSYEDEVYVEWAPNECYAACWYEDFVVVECEDWGWEDECDCPEDDWFTEGICVEAYVTDLDSLIFGSDSILVVWVPSECYATCWFEDYTVVECEEYENEDECGCPDIDWTEAGICVDIEYDGESYTEWAPNECYAACWFEEYTLVDCDDIDWGVCDWEEDCDCELNTDEGICIAFINGVDTLVEWVPNECYADCWGFDGYSVVECEDFWEGESEWEWDNDWNGEWDGEFEGDFDCVLGLFEEELTTLQAFILALGECGLFELTDCILNAPTFDDDEAYIEYLAENCPEWYGQLMDESNGPSLVERYHGAQSDQLSSTKDVIEALDVRLLGNPVVDQLDIQINATEGMNLNMTLRTVTGRVINSEAVKLHQGSQVYSVSTAEMTGGTYLMTIASDEGVQTIKFVVAK